jgi:hydrogenase nickel incorporation protein HypB
MKMEIKIMKNILAANQNKAEEIKKLLSQKKILMINLIGAPGAGKTTLLEQTILRLKDRFRMAVIEGDIATDIDARRLQPLGIPIVQINTDGACHLESTTILKAFDEFNLADLDLVFVENVGNLVCPAEFDIGEYAKIAISSVTEGEDKPLKYPLLFREAKALLLSKTDLMPYTDFDKTGFYKNVKNINAELPVFEISCKKNIGMELWINWLTQITARIKK